MRNPLVKIVYPPKKYIYSPPKCKVISLLYWLFIINNYLTLPYLLPFYSPGDEMHTNLYLSLLLLLDTLSNIFLLNINLPTVSLTRLGLIYLRQRHFLHLHTFDTFTFDFATWHFKVTSFYWALEVHRSLDLA